MTVVPQRGVLAHPPQHLLVAAFRFVSGDNAPTNRANIEKLRDLLRRELAGDLEELTALTPKDVPSPETGEVGAADGWEQTNLTVDLGISTSGFVALGYPPEQQPADLTEVPWAKFGSLAPAFPISGDLVLHIRADNIFAVEHVVRRVEHSLRGQLMIVWTVGGTQRYGSPGDGHRDHGRSVIGFLDGLSNLNPQDPEDLKLIVVDPEAVPTYPRLPAPAAPGTPGYTGQPQTPTDPTFPADLRQPPPAEPAWTAQGSYLFVRASTYNTADWDERALRDQEAAVGRYKSSGAFLDREDTSAHKDLDPTFTSKPSSVLVSPISHARRANPRSTPQDAARRVLRRGYPLIQPGTNGLARGLTFVSFSRSLSTQPEFIMAGWLFNPNFPAQGSGIDPLMSFEVSVLAGGYYFVPALSEADNPTSWVLPPA